MMQLFLCSFCSFHQIPTVHYNFTTRSSKILCMILYTSACMEWNKTAKRWRFLQRLYIDVHFLQYIILNMSTVSPRVFESTVISKTAALVSLRMMQHFFFIIFCPTLSSAVILGKRGLRQESSFYRMTGKFPLQIWTKFSAFLPAKILQRTLGCTAIQG